MLMRLKRALKGPSHWASFPWIFSHKSSISAHMDTLPLSSHHTSQALYRGLDRCIFTTMADNPIPACFHSKCLGSSDIEFIQGIEKEKTVEMTMACKKRGEQSSDATAARTTSRR